MTKHIFVQIALREGCGGGSTMAVMPLVNDSMHNLKTNPYNELVSLLGCLNSIISGEAIRNFFPGTVYGFAPGCIDIRDSYRGRWRHYRC